MKAFKSDKDSFVSELPKIKTIKTPNKSPYKSPKLPKSNVRFNSSAIPNEKLKQHM